MIVLHTPKKKTMEREVKNKCSKTRKNGRQGMSYPTDEVMVHGGIVYDGVLDNTEKKNKNSYKKCLMETTDFPCQDDDHSGKKKMLSTKGEKPFDPYPRIKVSKEEYESWRNAWKCTLVSLLCKIKLQKFGSKKVILKYT